MIKLFSSIRLNFLCSFNYFSQGNNFKQRQQLVWLLFNNVHCGNISERIKNMPVWDWKLNFTVIINLILFSLVCLLYHYICNSEWELSLSMVSTLKLYIIGRLITVYISQTQWWTTATTSRMFPTESFCYKILSSTCGDMWHRCFLQWDLLGICWLCSFYEGRLLTFTKW